MTIRGAISVCLCVAAPACLLDAAVFDVTAFGGKPDGKTQNRAAINRAIDAAAAAGGGLVELAAGTWVSGSVRLRSNVTLLLDPGATLEASSETSEYDAPEPNQWDQFQDFGHSHFHNSLRWAEEIHDAAIIGAGAISGKALTRGERGGGADKAIALKLCRNITLRDITISYGGHFGYSLRAQTT